MIIPLRARCDPGEARKAAEGNCSGGRSPARYPRLPPNVKVQRLWRDQRDHSVFKGTWRV